MAVLIMAQHSMRTNGSDNNNSNNGSKSGNQLQQLANPTFHDFLGMKASADTPVLFPPKTADLRLSEASPSPSASASLGASSGGGRGPISTTSDLGSERQVGNFLEGIPFYGPRSDVSESEISNRIIGNKRSNSDSAFVGSFRDRKPHTASEFLESSHLMKIMRNGAGGERSQRSNDDELLFAMQQQRPTSVSLICQTSPGSRLDGSVSKWERSIPLKMAPGMQYSPRGSHFVPYTHQVPSNRFRDANAGPSNISQSAADEGSRTGIKGSGILSSINGGNGVTERNSSVLPACSGQKSRTSILEHESSITPSRDGLLSASRQMTIFYGGQAHVFDDVHPNKADVIMALAGSNGGSWSTTFSPKSTSRPVNEICKLGGENDIGMASNTDYARESHSMTMKGSHQGSIMAKDNRNPMQSVNPGSEDKRRDIMLDPVKE